jgi:hypothetical protein
VFCINNCSNSAKKDGEKEGAFDRGECVVKRTPDLEDSELEIIEANCICGDVFSGEDCSKEAWETVLEEKLALVASAAVSVGVVVGTFSVFVTGLRCVIIELRW